MLPPFSLYQRPATFLPHPLSSNRIQSNGRIRCCTFPLSTCHLCFPRRNRKLASHGYTERLFETRLLPANARELATPAIQRFLARPTARNKRTSYPDGQRADSCHLLASPPMRGVAPQTPVSLLTHSSPSTSRNS